MQPLGPSERRKILANVPDATEEEIDEYEGLLAERFGSDPSKPDPDSDAREARIKALSMKLFPDT